MRLLISEVLDKIELAPTKEEKIALFKKHETKCLRGLMRINFDSTVNMNLPKGIPPVFNKIDDKPIGMDHSYLEMEYKKFYIWLDSRWKIDQKIKETQFVKLLEALHHKEAEILCLVKDQTLHYRYPSITEDIIRETWQYLMPPKEELIVKPEEKEGIVEKIKKPSGRKGSGRGRVKGSKNKPKVKIEENSQFQDTVLSNS